MELLQVDTLEETFQKLESYARGDGPRGDPVLARGRKGFS